jgi:hypothetical protein
MTLDLAGGGFMQRGFGLTNAVHGQAQRDHPPTHPEPLPPPYAPAVVEIQR